MYTANGYLPCGGKAPTPYDCDYPPYEAKVELLHFLSISNLHHKYNKYNFYRFSDRTHGDQKLYNRIIVIQYIFLFNY